MPLLRLALIGKTGVGKSMFGNTVLKERVFESSSRGSSVTTICQVQNGKANDRSVSIVDTPGFHDTRTENQTQILNEITRCIYLSAPGPHAICFVVSIGRFTAEDIVTLNAFVKYFGDAMYKYVIVVFTRFDDYKRDCEGNEEECDIHNYIKTLPSVINRFIVDKCGSRVIGFDNTLKGDASNKQITELLEMVDEIVKNNNNTFYSNEDFKKAEDVIKAEMEQEKIRLHRQMEQEMEKRQKEIDAAADEKSKIEIKAKMKAFEAEMKEKMESENLRKKAQESDDAFEIFKKVVSIVAPIAEMLIRAILKP